MPKPKHPKALVTIATVITVEQRERLLKLAAVRDRPISHLMREAVQAYLDNCPEAGSVEAEKVAGAA